VGRISGSTHPLKNRERELRKRGGEERRGEGGLWEERLLGGGMVSVVGRLFDKSEISAAIHGNLLFLTWSAGSRPLAGFPMGVGMLCARFGSNRSGKGSLGAHMSMLSWHLHA